MSDDIVINITPSPIDPVLVNVSSTPDNIEIDTSSYGVVSVNGKIGIVILTKYDLDLGNVDNTSDWLKPLSYATLTALQSFSFVLASSSFWNSVYTEVNVNSANWVTAYNVSTIVQNNSAYWEITSDIIPTITNYLSTNNILVSSIDTIGQILSAGKDLFEIFSTTNKEAQTLFYDITSQNLTITNGNTVNLSALSYRNIEDPTSMIETIEQFANSYSGSIYQGYTVTLYNGRVYTFAGTDKNNPNHYLEVNSNPYKPIYREISLSGDQVVIDSFNLADFKSAKYNLQIETNFNNEIYYSEVNIVGSVQTSNAIAVEYGQIYTDQLIIGYGASLSLNLLNLILYFNLDFTPNRKLLVKGHRTNFYKI